VKSGGTTYSHLLLLRQPPAKEK